MHTLTNLLITRRPATKADIPFLIELRRQTMNAHIIASGLDPSDSALKRRVLDRFECAEIILCDSKESGLLKVQRSGNAWSLIQIQIIPSLQGKGIGSKLIREVIEEARHEHVNVKLSVLKKNPALDLYKRLGFLIVKEGDHSYEMMWALLGKPGSLL